MKAAALALVLLACLDGGSPSAPAAASQPPASPGAPTAPAGQPELPPLPPPPAQPAPPLPEPALGATARFEDLGTTVTRVFDGRHHYAKDSPWNADESLAMTADGVILDGRTFAPLGRLSRNPSPNEHKVWSNTDPRHVYGVHRQRRQWIRADATDPSRNVVLATYPQYRSVSFGMYEGNLDNADSAAVLVGDGARPFVIDPRTGAVRCTMTKTYREVEDATVSQDGRWALVSHAVSGNTAVDVFAVSDCSFQRTLVRDVGHWDACVSSAGEQVLVGALGDPRRLGMIRMADGADLGAQYVDSALRIHVSCRNTLRPGWAYVSVYNDTCDRRLKGMNAFGRIFAVRLDGSGTQEQYAWDHQACPSRYDENPMASPSPRGDRVWWKVNWDGASRGIHSFVAAR